MLEKDNHRVTRHPGKGAVRRARQDGKGKREEKSAWSFEGEGPGFI